MSKKYRSEAMAAIHETMEALHDRKPHQLPRRVQIQLLHDPPAMRIHRVHAQIQKSGDILIRLPLGNQVQHLTLPATQQIQRIRHMPTVIAQHRITHRRIQIPITLGHRAHRQQQFHIT